MRLPHSKSSALSVGIWILIGGVIFFARHAKVTPSRSWATPTRIDRRKLGKTARQNHRKAGGK